MITSQTKQSAEMNNLANHLKRRQQHDGKIPKLTGIGGFRLLDKTSTQAYNATGGLAKYKLLLTAFRDEERQRGPREGREVLGKTGGPGVENSNAIFGKTEGPWERIGAWGGEFLCNFGALLRS